MPCGGERAASGNTALNGRGCVDRRVFAQSSCFWQASEEGLLDCHSRRAQLMYHRRDAGLLAGERSIRWRCQTAEIAARTVPNAGGCWTTGPHEQKVDTLVLPGLALTQFSLSGGLRSSPPQLDPVRSCQHFPCSVVESPPLYVSSFSSHLLMAMFTPPIPSVYVCVYFAHVISSSRSLALVS